MAENNEQTTPIGGEPFNPSKLKKKSVPFHTYEITKDMMSKLPKNPVFKGSLSRKAASSAEKPG